MVQEKVDPAGPLVMRVSEISRIIRDALDDPRLQNVWVRGEISGYTHHRSGHRYFSLLEHQEGRSVVVQCVMFRNYARQLAFTPEDGLKVVARGDVQVYEPQGRYQLVIRELSRAGAGERHLMIEEWKRMLEAEGIFSAAGKKTLPRYPKTVGVVTSASGAALQDILHVIRRRYPVPVILSPTPVQGDGVHEDIARAVEAIDGRVDVIIIGRGGGSVEDLFSFSHPRVVRAVAATTTPIISAVGHEVDWALTDFAADIRAPTPSAAAELAVPDQTELRAGLEDWRSRMLSALRSALESGWRETDELQARLQPSRLRRLVNDRMQQTVDLNDRMARAAHTKVGQEILRLRERAAALESHNPYRPLREGYCMAKRNGSVITSAQEIAFGDRLDIHLHDGTCRVEVLEVEHGREL